LAEEGSDDVGPLEGQ